MRATIGCGRTAHRDTDAYLASSSAAKRACRTPGGVPLRQLSRWLTCARPAGHDRGPELANIDPCRIWAVPEPGGAGRRYRRGRAQRDVPRLRRAVASALATNGRGAGG